MAEKIASTIQIENRNGAVGGYQMLNTVKQFHKYLEHQAAMIRRNFTEFGSNHSGAAYILKQIQSAIAHFENSVTAEQRQLNLLDA